MNDSDALFDMGEVLGGKPPRMAEGGRLQTKLWTKNKAALIARYLRYFTFVTKHGTYIDAFAGPQEGGEGKWAAERVVEQTPRWLNDLVFFEKDPVKVEELRALIGSQPARGRGERKRKMTVIPGDTNVELPAYLDRNPLREKQASFALLDQRTFELHWSTVEALAAAKPQGKKIEQFYFLAEKWFGRAAARRRTFSPEVLTAWWGNPDWGHLNEGNGFYRSDCFKKRFTELGYKHVLPLPIYREVASQRVMFYMIHASDDERAPQLMVRAYNRAVRPMETKEQLMLELEDFMEE